MRKTRESMTESVLQTFERDVLGESNPIIGSAARNSRQHYRYPNGSMVIVGGILQGSKDQRSKLLGTEYDGIYWSQLEEGMESDWQKLSTRLTNFRMPYQQMLADFNADVPLHWIYSRGKSGKLKILYTTHKDNPRWWDAVKEAWTIEGAKVIEQLSGLTGVERTRYYLGQAALATGLIYGDVWSDGALDGNVAEAAEYIPGGGEVVWAIDDGYEGKIDEHTGTYTGDSHPRVFLLAQIRGDGQVAIFAEHHNIKKFSDVHIRDVLKLSEDNGWPIPSWTVPDKSAAELRGKLHSSEFGLYTRSSPSSVEESIKQLRTDLGKDSNGRRKIIVHPRCSLLRQEMGMYRKDDNGRVVKEFDHTMDALRYLAWACKNG